MCNKKGAKAMWRKKGNVTQGVERKKEERKQKGTLNKNWE